VVKFRHYSGGIQALCCAGCVLGKSGDDVEIRVAGICSSEQALGVAIACENLAVI
jgi:hypothetical protein